MGVELTPPQTTTTTKKKKEEMRAFLSSKFILIWFHSRQFYLVIIKTLRSWANRSRQKYIELHVVLNFHLYHYRNIHVDGGRIVRLIFILLCIVMIKYFQNRPPYTNFKTDLLLVQSSHMMNSATSEIQKQTYLLYISKS